MKRIFFASSLFLIAILLENCSEKKVEPQSTKNLVINFQCGSALSASSRPNIYVVWAQNADQSFIQNFTICKKLISGGLTGTALPYWKTNVYPKSEKSEVDAVTGPTKPNTNFALTATLKDPKVRKFKLYFEIDHSFDSNDWFSDQPALLYATDVDLDGNITAYELKPCGWTPNENTQNIISNTPMGILQSEIRYITNLKSGMAFGATDSRSATNMVEKISLEVK